MPPSGKQPSTNPTALVIFAKAPVPGQVKTRLCPPLTPDEAATLHGTFVLDSLERTKVAIAKWRLPIDRYVACAPSSSLVFFKILEERHDVRLLDQVGEDLGQRMGRVFTELFGRGYERVGIVGTDVPTLPLSEYQRAFSLLDAHDVVLGPATDGGYYFIGLKRLVPELFIGIPWSTCNVFAATKQKATGLNLTVGLLTEWRDVDVAEDLQALIHDCAQDTRRPKQDKVFSGRTTGALQLLGTRLKSR